MNEKVALFIGRFAPPHKGHIEAIMKYANSFDKVVIGLGSCYEVGTSRHPLLATFREKMLLYSLYNEGCDLNKISIVHVQDYPTFEEWLGHILNICNINGVTHFVTGNEKDILKVLKSNNITLPFEFINPEETSTIPYHASDLRKAIIEGNYSMFKEIAASGTVALMGSVNGFNGIREAIENVGTPFFGGRQTVDLVFTLCNRQTGKSGAPFDRKYVLCGFRSAMKKDYPNSLGLPGDAINDYESPIDASLRALKEKTGINVHILDRKLEPAHVLVETGASPIIAELKFLKMFSSSDPKLAGTNGGSSQCFHINVNTSPDVFSNIEDTRELSDIKFRPVGEVLEEGLAYQQTEMTQLAIDQVGLYDTGGYARVIRHR